MSNLHKPFVWWRRSNPGFRRPPGELLHAAKRCLTPNGDEKCLAITGLTALISSRVQALRQSLSSYIGETENDRKADLGRDESKPHRQEAQSRIIPDSTQIDPEYVWGDEGPSND
jgi:hypothetical protein